MQAEGKTFVKAPGCDMSQRIQGSTGALGPVGREWSLRLNGGSGVPGCEANVFGGF